MVDLEEKEIPRSTVASMIRSAVESRQNVIAAID